MITNIVKLNKELTALRTEKQESVKSMSSLEDKMKNLETEKTNLETKVKELESKIVETKKEEAATIVAVTESVNEKVVKKMAALGVPEGIVKEEVVSAPAATDSNDIYKTFDSLSGKDKIDFFKKNEKVILGAMKQMHSIPVNKVNQALKTI